MREERSWWDVRCLYSSAGDGTKLYSVPLPRSAKEGVAVRKLCNWRRSAIHSQKENSAASYGLRYVSHFTCIDDWLMTTRDRIPSLLR